jgi:hypothetical protein
VLDEGRDAGVAEALFAARAREQAQARAASEFERRVRGARRAVARGREQLDAPRRFSLMRPERDALDAQREDEAVGRFLGRALDRARQLDRVARLDEPALVEALQTARIIAPRLDG